MKVYACPKCGSKSSSQEHILGLGTSDYICYNCSYTAPRSDWDIAQAEYGSIARQEHIEAYELRRRPSN